MNAVNHDCALVVRAVSAPSVLFLLFHGYGSNAHALLPIGQRLAHAFPNAMIVSVNAPDPTPNVAGGFHWFSAWGVTEANRPTRVAETMPRFVDCVRHWQAKSGVPAAATALIGFSQGGIMALESCQEREPLAGRVLAVGARFATLPRRLPTHCVVHLVHGKEDPVIPYGFAVEGAQTLIARGADITADVIPHLGHGINEDALQTLIDRLQTYVPKRLWEEALRAVVS